MISLEQVQIIEMTNHMKMKLMIMSMLLMKKDKKQLSH